MSKDSVLRSVWNYSLDTTYEGALFATNISAFFLAVLGGSAMALADALDKTMTASYFASGDATLDIRANLTAPEYNLNVLEGFPFKKGIHSQGEFSYTLRDFVQPNLFRLFSVVAIVIAVLLRILAANLHLRKAAYLERRFFKDSTETLAVPMPSVKEHAYLSLSVASQVLTVSCLSNSLLAFILQFSPILRDPRSFTYPSKGNITGHTEDYNGPIETEKLPIEFALNRKNNVTIFGIDVDLLEKFRANGTAVAKYGAAVTFSSKNETQHSLIPSTIGTVLMFMGHNFFDRKVNRERNKRLESIRVAPVEPSISVGELVLNSDTPTPHGRTSASPLLLLDNERSMGMAYGS